MSAQIIPFKRPEAPTAPLTPAPIITTISAQHGHAAFVGTKEQLLAYGVCEEKHLPAGKKRTAYNGGNEPTVYKLKGGKFCVSMHAGKDEHDLLADMKATLARVALGSDPPRNRTTLMLRAINDWRYDMIVSHCPGYEAGLLEAVDRARREFELAACEMALCPPPIGETSRTPPDEREPEHAQ